MTGTIRLRRSASSSQAAEYALSAITAAGFQRGRPRLPVRKAPRSNSGPTPSRSWRSPPVRWNVTGRPRASQRRWSFVEKPPRERPSACPPVLRRRPGGVGVGANDAAVEQVRLPARLRRHRPQRGDDPLPDAGGRPALEPAPGGAPVHQIGREVAPRRAGPGQPEHGFEEAAVVKGRPPGPGLLGRQQGREAAATSPRSAWS